MENLPVDLAHAPPNRGRAVRARGEANAVSGDPIAPRLIELAEKLEGDAVCDEEDTPTLWRKGEATPLRQHDRDAGASGRSFPGPRKAAGVEQRRAPP